MWLDKLEAMGFDCGGKTRLSGKPAQGPNLISEYDTSHHQAAVPRGHGVVALRRRVINLVLRLRRPAAAS